MSSRRPIRTKEIQNPDRILSNMLRDYVDGSLDDYAFLYRASVVKIDQEGGKLESVPPNPKNSIKARIITNARDKDLDDSELSVFWPLFTHDVLPIKEGEHVYVIFEDPANKTHGMWISRIPEPLNTDNANLTPGIKKYKDNSVNDFSDISAEQSVQDTDSSPTSVFTSAEFVPETVPKFHARVGDRVIEGSNNALIVLGRDRPDNKDSGERESAGTIDIVVGRIPDSSDMSLVDDKSRIYLTMNSDVDENFNIDVGDGSGPSAAIVIKSDEIRIVARNGMKIVVDDGDVTIDAKTINLGNKASEPAVLGDTLVDLIGQIVDQIVAMTVTTNVGPSGPPINAIQFSLIKEQLNTAKAKIVKVK